MPVFYQPWPKQKKCLAFHVQMLATQIFSFVLIHLFRPRFASLRTCSIHFSFSKLRSIALKHSPTLPPSSIMHKWHPYDSQPTPSPTNGTRSLLMTVLDHLSPNQAENRRFKNIKCSLQHNWTPGVSGNSRSRSFPRMEASDSLSRILGIDFFIPFPFPNFGNGFFSFPSRSRILGMEFFIPFPFPNFGNVFF